MFQAENAVPLAYYYRGPGRIVALPHPVDSRSYDVAQFVVYDAGDVRAIAARWGIHGDLAGRGGGCHSLNVRYGLRRRRARTSASHYRKVEERPTFIARP